MVVKRTIEMLNTCKQKKYLCWHKFPQPSINFQTFFRPFFSHKEPRKHTHFRHFCNSKHLQKLFCLCNSKQKCMETNSGLNSCLLECQFEAYFFLQFGHFADSFYGRLHLQTHLKSTEFITSNKNERQIKNIEIPFWLIPS